MNKREQILAHKLVVLSMLLLENLDEMKPTTQRMTKVQQDLTEFCELLNESLNDTETIQKTTYFQEIATKVDTILRKNYDPEL
jgi:hypothetical protein